MKLSVVIPLFNEESVIEDTNRRIIDVVGNLAGKRLIDDYEIIYVDDGSGDGSLNIFKKFTETSPKIRVLSFSRNFGHQQALVAGILHSSGDAVVSLAADLQDPPELMEEMILRTMN